MQKPINRNLALATLWGGAIADAIGNPLEFKNEVTPKDVAHASSAPVLYPSDDTQMTLFTYEGLLKGWGPSEPSLAWYETQRRALKSASGPGLRAFKTMYSVEAPGATCMSSCARLFAGLPVENDSKGNGTVMRAAPFAVWAYLNRLPLERAYLAAKEDALVTHKHPAAAASSVALVNIMISLFDGAPLMPAVFQALGDAKCFDDTSDLWPVYLCLDKTNYLELRSRGRAGWVAEEALALAIGANLHSKPNTFMEVVTQACCGIGIDSDTVAGIAGSIAAARGLEPTTNFRKRLYSADAIQYIADSLWQPQE